jgi:WhiB family redox-sensing transcriptional regulator
MANWREQANCKGTPTKVFFPQRGDYETLRLAKELCATCPVRLKCLEECLNAPQEHDWHGIFAGLGPRSRNRMRQERAEQGSEFRVQLPKRVPTKIQWSHEKQKYITVKVTPEKN